MQVAKLGQNSTKSKNKNEKWPDICFTIMTLLFSLNALEFHGRNCSIIVSHLTFRILFNLKKKNFFYMVRIQIKSNKPAIFMWNVRVRIVLALAHEAYTICRQWFFFFKFRICINKSNTWHKLMKIKE